MKKYEAGEWVRVVSVDNCVFGSTPEMRLLIGTDVQIIDVGYNKGHAAYRYTIAEDCGHWWWDETCFEPTPTYPLPEFEAEESLYALLH